MTNQKPMASVERTALSDGSGTYAVIIRANPMDPGDILRLECIDESAAHTLKSACNTCLA